MKKLLTKTEVLSEFPTNVEQAKGVLQFLGVDTSEEAVEETPQRFLSGLSELTWGERVPEAEFFTTINTQFDVSYDEMVVVKDIDFVSLCQHHVLPFIGTVKVGYLPSTTNVLGLSKLARIVEYYAARLQTQERLAMQIAEAVDKVIPVKGVAVTIEASHLCMTIRGIKSKNSLTVTSKMSGAFRESPATRAEFLQL